MGKITELLDSFDVSENKVDLDKLYSIFKSVEDIPIMKFSLYHGHKLVRQRVNNNGRIFNNISELSYPPATQTRYGRANIPNIPVFYACTFLNWNPTDTETKTPPRLIALLETSDFCKDKSESGIQRATVSIWKIQKKLNLIALPFSNFYDNPCRTIQELNNVWQNMLTDPNIDPDGLELIKTMSKEIATDFSSEYKYIFQSAVELLCLSLTSGV